MKLSESKQSFENEEPKMAESFPVNAGESALVINGKRFEPGEAITESLDEDQLLFFRRIGAIRG